MIIANTFWISALARVMVSAIFTRSLIRPVILFLFSFRMMSQNIIAPMALCRVFPQTSGGPGLLPHFYPGRIGE